MAHIEVKDLQQFSENERLQLTAVDPTLEATYAAEVISQVSLVYDTSTWLTPATTPSLIKSIIAANVVAQIYERQYSEDANEEGWYPKQLRRWAFQKVQQIIKGELILQDAPGNPNANNDPLFFPTDFQETDEQGNEIKFRMGQIF